MATHLNIAACLVVLTCLLHSTISEHTKKTLIVKVPHVIKHIHHQHYKPVHVHKAHAKKVEHHHHDSDEEKWEHKGHHGSFSHVKPVVEPADHLDSGESSVEQGSSREGQGYDVEDFQERRHQNPWRTKNSQRNNRPTHIRDDSNEWSSLVGLRGSRAIFNEDNIFVSEEDLSGHRDVRHRGNSQNNQRSKQRNKEASQNMDESGWRPLMNFDSFKDVDDVKHNYRGRHHDQYIHSGEDQTDENTRDEGDYHKVSHSKKKRKQRKNKKNSNKSKKWNKEIKVHDESSEEEPQVIVQSSKSYQLEKPAPLVAQVPVQFIPLPVTQQVQIQPHQQQTIQQQPLLQQQVHHQQILQLPQAVHQPFQQMPQTIHQPIQQHFKQSAVHEQPHQPLSAPSHAQHSSWPASQHANSQTQHSSWPAASSQQVQHQWKSQSSSSLTTQSPKVSVWTGHHLKLPNHSMWQVQQHSVSASSVPANPIQMLTVNHDSPAHQPTPPQHHFTSQLPEASQAVHKVVAPTWPHTHSSQDQQGSPARQVWQQSVQNAGSAYTMEVVNFGTQNNNRQK